MTIKEYMKKDKWLVVLKDKSKWVIDFQNKCFDNYKWYKTYGTLESELTEEMFNKFIVETIDAKKIEGVRL